MEHLLERGTFEIPYFNTGKKACVMPYKTISAIYQHRGYTYK
ncbi:hypothetical protein [Prevotella sp.]|nr:hypothetical protein [Prevotella sp.]